MGIIGILRSRRYAVTLIILIIISLVLATVIPQQGRLSGAEWFQLRSNHPLLYKIIRLTGLDHVYTTWWFLTIIALFSLNITLNLRERSLVSWKQYEDALNPSLHLPLRQVIPGHGDFKELEALLKRHRYRVKCWSDALVGVKARIGYFWVPLFHGGILVVLSGVLISGLFRFSGTVELSEGQEFFGRDEEFINRNYGLTGYRPDMDFSLKLMRFQVEYWQGGQPKLYRSLISVRPADREAFTRDVEMNKPLRYKGYSLYQSKYFGYSAVFGLSKNGSGIEDTGFVNLPYREDYKDTILRQNFVIPLLGYPAFFEYKPSSDSLSIKIMDSRRVIYNGNITRGEKIDLGDYIIHFYGIVQWTGLYISSDPGIGVVYIGFTIIVLSVFGMVYLYPRRLFVILKDNSIEITADAGRRKEEFKDEFEEILKKIKETVS